MYRLPARPKMTEPRDPEYWPLALHGKVPQDAAAFQTTHKRSYNLSEILSPVNISFKLLIVKLTSH